MPVIGVAKSGWGLDQFRDYAAASLKLNGMDPDIPAARTMLGLLRYVDGDLDDDAFAQATDVLGLPQVFELLTLVGYYDTLSLQLRVLRVAAPRQ